VNVGAASNFGILVSAFSVTVVKTFGCAIGLGGATFLTGSGGFTTTGFGLTTGFIGSSFTTGAGGGSFTGSTFTGSGFGNVTIATSIIVDGFLGLRSAGFNNPIAITKCKLATKSKTKLRIRQMLCVGRKWADSKILAEVVMKNQKVKSNING
jgi:hypothetical protein